MTLADLESHRWVQRSLEEGGEYAAPPAPPVSSHSSTLSQMFSLGFPSDYVAEALRNKELNHATATYQILLSESSSNP